MNTVAIIISRSYPIKQCLKAIEQADIPRKELRLLLYLDTANDKLIDYCLNWLINNGKKFKEANIFITGRKPIDVRYFQRRWKRIIKNMNWIRNFTKDSEIVFMVEDDTIIPKDAFTKLYKKIKSDKMIGCVQGVEAMRGGLGKPCGAWITEVKNGKVIRKIGLKARKKGISEINGGGYYCWVFRQKAIEQIKFRASKNGLMGPDMWTWYDMGRNGYKTLVDWSVKCGHIDKLYGRVVMFRTEFTQSILYDFSKDSVVPTMTKL